MKTGNRPTASSSPTAAQLAALYRGARRLWSTDLRVEPEEREALSMALTSLDLDIERLRIRASCNVLRSEDADELAACAERLAHLQRRWLQRGSAR